MTHRDDIGTVRAAIRCMAFMQMIMAITIPYSLGMVIYHAIRGHWQLAFAFLNVTIAFTVVHITATVSRRTWRRIGVHIPTHQGEVIFPIDHVITIGIRTSDEHNDDKH